MYYQKYKNGFTLIELLIVVTIIVIVSAIAVPSFKTQIFEYRMANELHRIETCFKESQIKSLTLRTNVIVRLNGNSNMTLQCGNDAPIALDEKLTLKQLGSDLSSQIRFQPDRFVYNASSGNVIGNDNGGYQFCYQGYTGPRKVIKIDGRGLVTTYEGSSSC